MDPRFLSFVWRYSKRDQIIITALAIASFPLVYYSLELPKTIINQAIGGDGGFPKEVLGFQLEQVPYLLMLCLVFLTLVVIINAIKWFMNVRIGITGERMLRRLRYMLFQQALLFRDQRLRTTKPGEIIQSIVGEIEPLGGFIGEVVSTPLFQGGLLIVYVSFIFIQDWALGLAAISLYPFQAWVIPKLQAKVIKLNRARALNTRKLADAIGQTINLIPEVQTNDTARWHMGQVSGRLYENTVIRIDLFKRKFTIKFINNFLNNLTPFFFYSIGGYLVIVGDLDFGALVAVLAAYKDVAAPWKAVLNYVQRWADFNSRYVFVVENFTGDGVAPPTRIFAEGADAEPLTGALVFANVEGGPGTGGLVVDRLEIAPGRMAAVAGGASGGREALMKLASGLQAPAAGKVTLGGKELIECSIPQLASTVAYVGAEPGIVARSMCDNLLYGLMRGRPELAGQVDADLVNMLREARLTGNPTYHPEGDWVDYALAGVAGPEELETRLLHLVDLVGLSGELYSGALNMRIGADRADGWTARILEARARLRAAGPDLSDLVEDWRPDAFNGNARLIENVLYGLPATTPPAGIAGFVDNAEVMRVIDAAGVRSELLAIGWDIAREFADLVDTVEANSTVLDSFPGYTKADIRAAHDVVVDDAGKAPGELGEDQRKLLLALAFGFVPVRDRLDVLDRDRIARLLAARVRARDILRDRPGFVAFDEERFSPARRVADNILHGQRRYDRKSQWKRLEEMMEAAIEAAGLKSDLIRLGLTVGLGGGDISTTTRRRIALVRGVIKRPRLLVIDGIAGTDTPADAALRRALPAELPGTTILYAALEEGATAGADFVARIAENGAVETGPAADAPAASRPLELARR